MTSKSPFVLGDLSDHEIAFLKSSGFPTFDEFQKNPEKYKGDVEEIFACIEQGPDVLRNATAGRHKLYVCGKKVSNMGHMMRVVKEMGFNPKKMTFRVNLENVGNGQYVHHVNMVPIETEFKEGGQGS